MTSPRGWMRLSAPLVGTGWGTDSPRVARKSFLCTMLVDPSYGVGVARACARRSLLSAAPLQAEARSSAASGRPLPNTTSRFTHCRFAAQYASGLMSRWLPICSPGGFEPKAAHVERCMRSPVVRNHSKRGRGKARKPRSRAESCRCDERRGTGDWGRPRVGMLRSDPVLLHVSRLPPGERPGRDEAHDCRAEDHGVDPEEVDLCGEAERGGTAGCAKDPALAVAGRKGGGRVRAGPRDRPACPWSSAHIAHGEPCHAQQYAPDGHARVDLDRKGRGRQLLAMDFGPAHLAAMGREARREEALHQLQHRRRSEKLSFVAGLRAG